MHDILKFDETIFANMDFLSTLAFIFRTHCFVSCVMEYYILILQHVPPFLFIRPLSIAPYLLVALFLAIHSFPVHLLDYSFIIEPLLTWDRVNHCLHVDDANE